MALPWLIGAAVVGTAAYLMSDSDSSSSTSSDESERREEKRRERQAKERQDINKEIETYKKQAKQRIKWKYNTDIEFSSNKLRVVAQDKELEKEIQNIEKDNVTLSNLLQELEDQYHATKS